MVIYTRIIFVIKEKLLQELHPTRETDQGVAWYYERRTAVVDSDGGPPFR
jgi:hypothetical protein